MTKMKALNKKEKEPPTPTPETHDESLELPISEQYRLVNYNALLGSNLDTKSDFLMDMCRMRKMLHYYTLSKLVIIAYASGMYPEAIETLHTYYTSFSDVYNRRKFVSYEYMFLKELELDSKTVTCSAHISPLGFDHRKAFEGESIFHPTTLKMLLKIILGVSISESEFDDYFTSETVDALVVSAEYLQIDLVNLSFTYTNTLDEEEIK